MILQRPDIAGGVPVPVVLPLFSLRYQKAEILSTYIPKLNGGVNHGSILYVFGKIDLK
jgi:palmitoyl transferase